MHRPVNRSPRLPSDEAWAENVAEHYLTQIEQGDGQSMLPEHFWDLSTQRSFQALREYGLRITAVLGKGFLLEESLAPANQLDNRGKL